MIMEKKMETMGIIGFYRGYSLRFRVNIGIMENQTEKKLENEMETGFI